MAYTKYAWAKLRLAHAYWDYFLDFVTKLLLRSNSLRNQESSPLFLGPCAHGHWPKASGPSGHLTAKVGKRGAGAVAQSNPKLEQFRGIYRHLRTGF